LFKVLKRHTSIYTAAPETKFFEVLPLLKRRFADLENIEVMKRYVELVDRTIHEGYYNISMTHPRKQRQEPISPYFDEMMHFAMALKDKTHGSVFAFVFQYLTWKSGKCFWLEKTPSHVFHAEEILRCIPKAKLIHITRDPRDVLASKKTRRATVWDSDRYSPEMRSFKHLEKAYDPVLDTLSWKSAIRAGQEAARQDPDRVYTIRYEDLVREPEKQVHKLSKFIGLEFQPQMLQVASRNQAAWDKESRNHTGITADSVGRGLSVLRSSEMQVCQLIARQEMKDLGYACADTSIKGIVGMPVLFAKSMGKFLIRLYRKQRLGGWKYLLNLGVNYWNRLQKLLFPGSNRKARE
jgi:hypothetical protein